MPRTVPDNISWVDRQMDTSVDSCIPTWSIFAEKHNEIEFRIILKGLVYALLT